MNDNSYCLVGQICKPMLAAIVDISYLSLQMKQHNHSTIQASCPILFLEKITCCYEIPSNNKWVPRNYTALGTRFIKCFSKQKLSNIKKKWNTLSTIKQNERIPITKICFTKGLLDCSTS